MVGSKVARARPPRKIKVKDMICDMSEAYKISMVSMSKRLTNSRNERVYIRPYGNIRGYFNIVLVRLSKNLGYERPCCVKGTSKLTGLY